MSSKRCGWRPTVARIESQDDIAYLTGKRKAEDEEKQIKTPMPRRLGRVRRRRSKEEVDPQS